MIPASCPRNVSSSSIDISRIGARQKAAEGAATIWCEGEPHDIEVSESKAQFLECGQAAIEWVREVVDNRRGNFVTDALATKGHTVQLMKALRDLAEIQWGELDDEDQVDEISLAIDGKLSAKGKVANCDEMSTLAFMFLDDLKKKGRLPQDAVIFIVSHPSMDHTFTLMGLPDAFKNADLSNIFVVDPWPLTTGVTTMDRMSKMMRIDMKRFDPQTREFAGLADFVKRHSDDFKQVDYAPLIERIDELKVRPSDDQAAREKYLDGKDIKANWYEKVFRPGYLYTGQERVFHRNVPPVSYRLESGAVIPGTGKMPTNVHLDNILKLRLVDYGKTSEESYDDIVDQYYQPKLDYAGAVAGLISGSDSGKNFIDDVILRLPPQLGAEFLLDVIALGCLDDDDRSRAIESALGVCNNDQRFLGCLVDAALGRPENTALCPLLLRALNARLDSPKGAEEALGSWLRDTAYTSHATLRVLAERMELRNLSGAFPNVRKDTGKLADEAFREAVTRGELGIVKLLAPLASADMVNIKGERLVFTAAHKGHWAVLEHLATLPDFDIHARDASKRTLLMCAAAWVEHEDSDLSRKALRRVVKQLLKRLEDVEWDQGIGAKDADGRSALVLDAASGSPAIIDLLIDAESKVPPASTSAARQEALRSGVLEGSVALRSGEERRQLFYLASAVGGADGLDAARKLIPMDGARDSADFFTTQYPDGRRSLDLIIAGGDDGALREGLSSLIKNDDLIGEVKIQLLRDAVYDAKLNSQQTRIVKAKLGELRSALSDKGDKKLIAALLDKL